MTTFENIYVRIGKVSRWCFDSTFSVQNLGNTVRIEYHRCCVDKNKQVNEFERVFELVDLRESKYWHDHCTHSDLQLKYP